MTTMPLLSRPLPRMARVRQSLPEDHVADVRAETFRRLRVAGIRDAVGAGHRIAVTAGSRGMGGHVELIQGIVDAVRDAGGQPFVIPAMGSHGGAVPEGQVEILRRLGVTEESVGAPIRATMETVDLGPSETAARAHLDRYAHDADGIIVLGRVKTHPESTGLMAAGLLKMTTVGLGKQAGAQQAHSHGLWDSIRAVPRVTLEKSKVLFGVASVENGYRKVAAIEVVPGRYEAFLEVDRRLLKLAKRHLTQLPFDRLDVLALDEIGKDVSGTGMDPNVVGKWRVSGEGRHRPDFRRVVVLSLTRGSLGNGLGIGMADFTTRRFVKEFDPAVTYVNLLTATEPDSWNSQEGLVPIALDSDRLAMEVALYSSLTEDAPRVCRVKNTCELADLWVSEALVDEVKGIANLEILSEPEPLPFDGSGNLF